MSSIPNVSLEDTYYLVQLAREAALARGRQAQADQLKPVVDGMRSLVEKPQAQSAAQAPTQAKPAPASDLAADTGFQKLLELSRQAAAQPPSTAGRATAQATSLDDRNRLVQALAEGGTSHLDIARQLGMTRDEVGLVLDTGRKTGINRR